MIAQTQPMTILHTYLAKARQDRDTVNDGMSAEVRSWHACTPSLVG